jgi:hypothetical protein
MMLKSLLSTFFAAMLLAVGASLAAEPVQTGERRLLVDDQLIDRIEGLKRTLHSPTDVADNPVLLPDRPWEHRRIPYGSVRYFPAERKFKCWYLAMNIYDSRPGFRGYRKQHRVPIHEAAFICYAESDDGLHWRKPELGLHEFRGSKKNNIVLTCPGTHFDSTSVMIVPDDHDWPYRMITFIGRWPYREDLVKKQWGDPPPFGIARHGHYAFGSKDGIHWQELNDNRPVLRASDRSMFWWDPVKRIYVGAAKTSHEGKRAQAYAWSRDMIHWKKTSDWIHRADEQDHPGDEAEASYGFRYGSQWLGFAEMRRVRKGQSGIVDHGVKINWELLTSSDGRHWNRPIRRPFFDDAGPETWRYQVLKVFANPPIEQDGSLLIYYGGKTGTVPVEEGYEPFQALCLAELRKDGFVSLDAGKQPGMVLTRAITITGRKLRVNVRAPDGELRVEILDESGKVAATSESVTGDLLDARVKWGRGNLADLQGQSVQLRFTLRNGEFYSWWLQ